MSLTATQLEAMANALKGLGTNFGATPAPSSTPNPVSTPVAATSTNTTAAPTMPRSGPTLNGQPLPPIAAPTPAPVATKTAAPFTGTLQGPYPIRNDAGAITSIQQGMKIVNGVQQPNTPMAALSSSTTAAPSNGIDKNALQAEVAARMAKLRAGVEGAVTSGKAARTSLFNFNKQNTQDQRALDAAMFQETNNPFGGKYQYDKTNILRNNGIQDSFAQNNYTNDINTLDNQLTSFDSLAPEQQQTLYNDLLRQERSYGLQEGALTGNLNGQRTLAGQAQDYNQSPTNPQNVGQNLQNQLTQMKLDNYPAESKAAAQQVQQQLTAGQLDIDTAKFKLDQLKDPNSPTNQAAKLDLQMKQIDAKNYPREAQLKLEQLQKQINQIGAAPYRSQDQLDYDKQQVIKIKAEIDKLNNPAKEKPTDYKTDPNFSQDVAHLKASPADAAKLDSNPQPFIDAYGYDGYLALRKAAGLD